MTTPVALVVDTDGGIDDAVALWWAATDPRVDLRAVLVTWGNVDIDTAFAVTAKILAAAGRTDIPVALGAAGPLGPTPLPELGTDVHGVDGLGGHAADWPTGGIEAVAEPAAVLLDRLTANERLTLVAIGPLSTIADALRREPAIVDRLADLVVMGGAVTVPGNALPAGEANIAHDPVAAAEVVSAEWPAPPLLVGLDATHLALLDRRQLELAAEGRTPAARQLAGPLRFYAEFCDQAPFTAPGTYPMHDLLAVVAAVDPRVLIDVPVWPLAVDTGGSAAWGATVADARPKGMPPMPGWRPWRVALGVDRARFTIELDRLLGDESAGPVPSNG